MVKLSLFQIRSLPRNRRDHRSGVVAFYVAVARKTHAMCALGHGLVESVRSVLFTTPMGEHYERRSLGITSNLVFSEWEKVLASPMTTAAAMDRIVHHSVILKFDLPSYRINAVQNRRTEEESDRPKCLTRISRSSISTWPLHRLSPRGVP